MRFALLLLVVVVMGGTACSYIPGFSEDCGCSAYYSLPKDGGEVKVQFREITAETVGGVTDCGFKDIPIKVTAAKIRGIEMPEIRDGNDKYLYTVGPDFDPAKDIVTIEWKGGTYISTVDSVKRIGDSVFFKLKQ